MNLSNLIKVYTEEQCISSYVNFSPSTLLLKMKYSKNKIINAICQFIRQIICTQLKDIHNSAIFP